MAIHARLAAPPADPRHEWPWHRVKIATVPAHLLWRGDRRMEAENYLSSGHGLRLSVQGRAVGWKPFRQFARVTQPNRTKGTLVSSEHGTPFLTATQVFDIRPRPRKWLAVGKIPDAEALLIRAGTILVTRSGAVGRATIATEYHEGSLVSDDLLRVESVDPKQAGWLYGYLRSSQARAMMTGVKYGHIIKHLEVSHLEALPIPVVQDSYARGFLEQTTKILDLRNQAHRLSLRAEEAFAAAVGPVELAEKEIGFSVRASAMRTRRRRFEASFYAPKPIAIINRFRASGLEMIPLSNLTEKVWWETRFRRFYGENGIPYLSANELFTISPLETKRILIKPDDEHEKFFVQRGWIVMACSGQVYGLNGAASLMTEYHENVFFSHDLIRIIVNRLYSR